MPRLLTMGVVYQKADLLSSSDKSSHVFSTLGIVVELDLHTVAITKDHPGPADRDFNLVPNALDENCVFHDLLRVTISVA